MAQDNLTDFLNTEFSDSEENTGEDIFKLYQEELKNIRPCTPEEEERLLEALLLGDKAAADRLVEGNLKKAVDLAESFRDKGLPLNDLIQEANMALILAVREYEGGDFALQMQARIQEAMEAALEFQTAENRIEEEMAARVNVLKDISASMANELGREATVAELAERMKMTEEEIRDIMKLTLDAMSVSGEGL